MADKKITELPYIDTLSGSLVGTNSPLQNTVIPLVLRGTTNQINIENFSKFVTAYSAHTGSAGNTFTGPQTINNNVTITGNTSIGGTLVVAGKITAQEFFTEITSASIIFESGSTVFGNSGDDTHTFTGSMLTTGSIILNGSAIGTGQLNVQTASQDLVNRGISSVTGSINTTTSSFDSVFLRISSTTGSINTTTSSFDSVFLRISSTTGSINTTTSSFDSVFLRISSTTGSINTTTSSFDSVFLGISSVTGAMNTQSSSQDLVNRQISSTTGSINTTTSSFNSVFLGISSVTGAINTQSSSQDLVNRQISLVTGSIHFVTGAFNSFSASVIGQTNTISTFTSSVNFTTQSLNTQTGSQDLVNRGISSVTGSINTTTSSFNSVFLGISSVTGAINTQSSSQDLVNRGISSVTGSINTTTSSFNSVFSQIGSTTSSLIGITNGLMAFTAALDSTYATDAQLYQLYQATASIHSTTASLNTQTGSQSNLNAQIGIATSSLNSVSASLIGITNGLMAFTASLDNTFATDAQLLPLIQATASIQFATASLNTQTGSQNSVNFNISVVTSSIDSHILKQATQTGSQDLVNLGISTYTGSQNVINTSVDSHILKQSTQTGSQDLVNLGISTFTGSLRNEVNLIEAYTASLKGAIEVSGQNINVLGMVTAQQFNVTYVSSSVMYKSGSTEFGDSSDDRHLFTGSLIVSGTLAAGTDETGWGRISFNEPTNTLRIQSSKNGTNCIPISFWSQRQGGGFAESVAISGSNLHVRSEGKLEVFRSDNTRSGSFYTNNLATIIEASTDPIRLSSPERAEIYIAGAETMRVSPTGGVSIYSGSAATIGLKTDSLYNSMIRDYTVETSTYLDIVTDRLDGGGFNFLMLVSSTLVASGGNRNYYTFAVAGRGTTGTATQLSNVNAGTASRTAIAVSFPSNGVIRLTLTGAENCQIKATIIGHGAL